MKDLHEVVNGKLQKAGVLLLVGMFTIFLSLFWTHALSFVVFCIIGALLCLLGIFMYLLWLGS